MTETNRSRTVRFIEFVGLPGAGKSTVAREVTQALRARGINVVTRETELHVGDSLLRRTLARLRLIVGYAHTTPNLWRWLILVAKTRQCSIFDFTKSAWSVLTIATFTSAQRRKLSTVCVLDQGILQSVWSFCLAGRREIDECWLELLGDEALYDVLFVVVVATTRTARNRLALRPVRDSRMQTARRMGDDAFWERTDRILMGLVSNLRQAESANGARARILILDAEKFDPTTNAKIILEHVLNSRIGSSKTLE